ncbi:MAG: hypothetical protein JXP34_05080, partial [Planctomycetes bacterium]|nr:hypothetical protein [Planctomycetota bacterium]
MRWFLLSCIILGFLGFAAPAPAQPTPEVVNALVNFDAVNAGNLPAQDLELELPGLSYCGVRDWYKGPRSWGLHPRMHYLDRRLPLVELDWTDPFRPILPGERRHFGVVLDPAAPPAIDALAWWSVKVRPIPFPWQRWEAGQGIIYDVVDLSEEAPGAVEIARQYIILDRAIPLEDLTWEALNDFKWMEVPGDPRTLAPGESVKIEIPLSPDPLAAVLVRYTALAEGVQLRVINEAVVEGSAAGAELAISGVLTNFDVQNRTDVPYEDFELHLMCLQPSDVIGWYNGALGWGMPPRINQIPGGTEVLWADPFLPWKPGEMYHFGVRLRPEAPPPIVTAWWTKKIPIPVPWQGWRLAQSPSFFDVYDEIVLSPEAPEPVTILREYAVTNEMIPLDRLTWDLAVDWQPVPEDPVVLDPGGRLSLPIPIDEKTAAVLVRYTVKRRGDPEAVTRFTNEAVLSPSTAVPAIAGSLSNFDVLNLTEGRVHDLELWLPGIRKEWILDWYNGAGAWGVHPGEFRIPGVPGTNIPDFTEILWKDPVKPLLPGTMAHFGVAVDPAWMVPGPREARAWWSVKVAPIPLPWQWWRIDPTGQGMVDVIRNTSDERVYVRRDIALLAAPVPLEDLNWDLKVDWQVVDREPVAVPPGEPLALDLPLMAPDMAALVRYEVYPDPQLSAEARVVNEAVIEAGRLGLALVNFDAHNFTDWRVADLELDLLGIDPDEVIRWYRGDRAWGNPPRISQIPQGTEVMWANPYAPLPHCEWRHFGIALRPETMDLDNPVGLVGVRAAWTIKVPIPLPWQTWRPEPGRVVDVIQASPVLEGAVRVERQYAVLADPVPLDDLDWDAQGIPWNPVAGDPVTLDPGKVLELPVEVDPKTQAVLVRYTTEDANANKVRVVNEAVIHIPPSTCPCVSHLVCDPMADGRVALVWDALCWNVTYAFTVDGAGVAPVSQTLNSAVVKIDPPCGSHEICVIAILATG